MTIKRCVRPWTNTSFCCFLLFVHGRTLVFLFLGCSSIGAHVFFLFLIVRPWTNVCFSKFLVVRLWTNSIFEKISCVSNRVRKHFYGCVSIKVSFFFHNFAIVNYTHVSLTDSSKLKDVYIKKVSSIALRQLDFFAWHHNKLVFHLLKFPL